MADYRGVALGASTAEFISVNKLFECSPAPANLMARADIGCKVMWTGPGLSPYEFGGGRASWINARFIGDRFGALDVVFTTEYFDTIVDALTVKYGKPGKIERIPVQSRGGANATNVRVTWRIGASSIVVDRYGTGLDNGMAMYEADWMKDAVRAREGAGATRNAKTL